MGKINKLFKSKTKVKEDNFFPLREDDEIQISESNSSVASDNSPKTRKSKADKSPASKPLPVKKKRSSSVFTMDLMNMLGVGMQSNLNNSKENNPNGELTMTKSIY